MIGLSVSFCIQDIVEGKVQEQDVEQIIGAICCRSREDFEYVVKNYRKSYWFDNPEVGESIFWRLLADGKIVQPRLTGTDHPGIRDGIWR